MLLSINLSKKHKEAVLNAAFTVTKYKLLNQRYPASTTHILQKFSNFCHKIKIFVAFHILASNITLVLRFITSDKFYVQIAKADSKDLSC